MRTKAFLTSVGVGLLLGLVFWTQVEAAETYQGKRVEILTHAPPGGTYDLNSRLLARHLPKHIPGNPSVIVRNMPGGGGLIQANYLFQRGKPDGTTIGLLASGVPQMEALGMPGIKYESRRFQWIGLIADTTFMVIARREAPVRTLEDLLDPNRPPLIVGTSGPPSNLHVIPAGLNLVLEKIVGRSPFKLIPGYAGMAPLVSALERGEIDGFSASWDSFPATAPHFLEPAPGKGLVHLVGYVGLVRDPELEQLKVPFIPDQIKNPKDRAVLDFLAAPSRTMYAVVAPPGLAGDRLKILREAFMKTVSDPQYIADIRKVNLEVRPLPGEELEKVVKKIMETPRDIIEIARGLFEK